MRYRRCSQCGIPLDPITLAHINVPPIGRCKDWDDWGAKNRWPLVQFCTPLEEPQ